MITILLDIVKKPKNILFVIGASIGIFFILRIIPVYSLLVRSFRIPGVTTQQKVNWLYEYTLSTFYSLPFLEQFLVLALAFATAFNILIFWMYIKRQQKVFSKKSFFGSLLGIFFGSIGAGCLSCGVLLIAPLLSILGLGAFTQGITHYALAISYLGLFLVIGSTLYLLHKLSKPLVC